MGRKVVPRKPYLNIASISLDAFWRDFAKSPSTPTNWTGAPSQGDSGTNWAQNASTPPTTGTPLNGNPVAHFDGVNDSLTLSYMASKYLAAGSFSGYFVFKATSAPTLVFADPFNAPGLLGMTGGNVGVCWSSAGFGIFHASTSGGWRSVHAECATGEWHVGTFSWDGTTLAVGIDGPPNYTVHCPPIDASLGTRTLFFGKNYNGAALFAGDMEQCAITKAQLSREQFREIVKSLAKRTGISFVQPTNVSYQAITTNTPSPLSTYVGTTHTNVASYTQRDGAKLHYLAAHNKYFLLGGWGSAPRPEFGGTQTTNEVWSAVPGNLATWTRELVHVQTPPTSGTGARFRPGHAFGSCQFDLGDGAGECVYVVGCDQYEAGLAQVWRASNPGSNNGWTRRQADAEFGRMVGLCVGQYGTEIHVVGGAPIEQSVIQQASPQHWVSTDGGLSFKRLADCPFRTSFLTQLTEHKGLLFALGGNGGGIGGGERVYQSAVWAWNGDKWHLQNANPGYPGAMWMNQISYDDRIWRIMGRFADAGTDDDNETWSSGDLGISWHKHENSPWTKSHADGVAVGPDGIVIASGFGVDLRVYTFEAT